MDELKKQREQLLKSIEYKEASLKRLQDQIKWDYKHLKLLDRQISEYHQSSAETLEEISDNLK